jgi:hypothetical protein
MKSSMIVASRFAVKLFGTASALFLVTSLSRCQENFPEGFGVRRCDNVVVMIPDNLFGVTRLQRGIGKGFEGSHVHGNKSVAQDVVAETEPFPHCLELPVTVNRQNLTGKPRQPFVQILADLGLPRLAGFRNRGRDAHHPIGQINQFRVLGQFLQLASWPNPGKES